MARTADTDQGERQRDVTMNDRKVEPPTARSTWVKDWAQHGVCSRTAEPDSMFVRGAAQRKAKEVCIGCPVIAQRLADSLDNHTEFGVWGGMTACQRRALLKRRPEVASRRALFKADQMHEEPPAS